MTSTIILSIIVLILVAATFKLYNSLRSSNEEMKNIISENTTKEILLSNLQSQVKELAQVKSINSMLSQENATLKEQVRNAMTQINEARLTINHLTPLSAENATLREQIRIINEEKDRLQQESKNQFTLLANEIFDDKTKRFKELNETRLSEILNPLREQIHKFENALNDNTKNDIKDRESLREHIRTLMELNQSIGKEAKELTQALKGNSKVQGDWGETILRTILENCGLQEGIEFTMQQTKDEKGYTLKNEEGSTIRPDAVVNFPGNKSLIIDSKVSLTNYIDFCSATDEDERNIALQKHIVSVKNHIKELKDFKYQKAIKNSADFIMMFIPNEGAYITAMQADNTLWKYAYDNHVVIISPTHLISVLKLVDQLWQHDKQTKNALRIAEETGKLYNKFANFVDDLLLIDKALNSGRVAYDNAINKLRTGKGNILSRIENIKSMGITTSKSLPIESNEVD